MKNMEILGVIFSGLLIVVCIFFVVQTDLFNHQSALTVNRPPMINPTTVQITPIKTITTVITPIPIPSAQSTQNSTSYSDRVTGVPLKTIKDSELWFSMQVPESWEPTTERTSNPEGYEGLVYITDLNKNDEFYIITYAISRDQDQSFRNYYRDTWTPLPNESTVTINGKIFDRFESKSDDFVKVAYVVRKGSANERGFASVIIYSLTSPRGYQQKDFESFILTFHYLKAKEVKLSPGEEIKK